MQSLVLALFLSAGSFGVAHAAAEPRKTVLVEISGASTSPSAPAIILPDSLIRGTGTPAPLLVALPRLITPPETGLLLPGLPGEQDGTRLIEPAKRPLTPEEAAAEGPLAKEDLQKLAAALVPPNASDGAIAQESSAWEANLTLRRYFSGGPLAPELPQIEAAAFALYERLLPRFYRRIPVMSLLGPSPRDQGAGHSWSPESGHRIVLPVATADAQGNVPSVFGLPGELHVQHKIEMLMSFIHEYAHTLFDASVRKSSNHPLFSAYTAITEGFAVTLERLLIERILEAPATLGLSPRDAIDLAALAAARQQWLAIEDTSYSEGVIPWRKVYALSAEQGLISFLASLSASRLMNTLRADPAYQLALGNPTLLAAYLGESPDHPLRRALELFAGSASGQILTITQRGAAAAAAEQAGIDGWRRVFTRTLTKVEPIHTDYGIYWVTRRWLVDSDSIEPAFALARLVPSAATELARWLENLAKSPDGFKRIFESRGPSPRLSALLAGVEALPWEQAARQAWYARLTRWLFTN